MKSIFDSYKKDKGFYQSIAWKNKRKQILDRDNKECQWCKAKGKVAIDDINKRTESGRKKIQLVVHHILELKDYPELALNDDNLITVCFECHERHHERALGSMRKEPKYDDEMW